MRVLSSPMDTSADVISQPTQVNGNATLRLILLSAYLFIGKEGEPRVGSGCDVDQGFRYNCTGNVEDAERYCHFYKPADRYDTCRVYLALRHADGFLDTVSAEGRYASQELRIIANNRNVYKSFATTFKLTKVNVSECMEAGVPCYNLSVGSHGLSIIAPVIRNISKLHKKAIDSSRHCMASPGPFQQHYGLQNPSRNTTGSPFYITFDKPWKGGRFSCDQEPFLTTTCKFGHLKRTYPIGHVNRRN